MKIIWERLFIGEFPILAWAKSRSVQVWRDDYWARQSNPVYRKKFKQSPSGLYDLNSYVPLLEVSSSNLKPWLKDKINMLKTNEGYVIVIYKQFSAPLINEPMLVGMFHDARKRFNNPYWKWQKENKRTMFYEI